MSKISQENKKAKKATKQPKENEPTKSAQSQLPNYGKCCTCRYFPMHYKGEAQPCKVAKAYVARKAEHPECYKCKIG